MLKLVFDSLTPLKLSTLEKNHLRRQIMKLITSDHLWWSPDGYPIISKVIQKVYCLLRHIFLLMIWTEKYRQSNKPKWYCKDHQRETMENTILGYHTATAVTKVSRQKNYQTPQRSSAQGKKSTNTQSSKYQRNWI